VYDVTGGTFGDQQGVHQELVFRLKQLWLQGCKHAAIVGGCEFQWRTSVMSLVTHLPTSWLNLRRSMHIMSSMCSQRPVWQLSRFGIWGSVLQKIGVGGQRTFDVSNSKRFLRQNSVF
jgi:hypothetical protein